ncbi:MAG: TonB-dependent receptor plug domain-containing protein, partial [Gemmatimonadetes bacterium]|nr:TonB-dependent receptor plug domain-containing protein [Gemmatimonadota bacterium]
MKHGLLARFTLASALLLGCFMGIARPALAQQGAIQGTVRDAGTGEPIATATVLVVGTARGSFADENGNYRIDLSAGTYTIRAALIGYEAVSRRVTVVAGETATVDFELPVGGLVADELVVIGSRTARTEFNSPVPIDVISEAEIRESAHVEVNQILRELVPSYNASHQTIGDGTDHINPASLRGLGPDQTLVLINGKRRHTSSVVHVNGTFGRGTVGVDLNSIPPAAIQRIEVLRDGAAAQYGSDAIAGVINIVLKDQTESLQATIMGGVTGEGDGAEGFVDANFGFPIGDRGFFNITAEFLNRERTNRSEPEERDIFPGISGTEATDAELARLGLTREDFSMKTGQAKAQFGAGFFNMVVPISESAEVYSFGGITHRKGRATGFYRLPNSEARVVSEIFPNGFLPQINPDIDDASIAAGVRGSRGGWDLDGSIAFGTNSWRWNIENTNNASQGAASPTTFDAGRYVFSETVGNVDAVKLIDTKGALQSLSLVLGAEFRVERFEEEAGEPASFLLGNGGDIPGVDFDTTSTGGPKDPGSQVFFGRTPENEADRFRNSFAGYVGLESQITDK